ncbi:MAG: ATPase domain-containing protein, partial [Nanoarchaeota archaeon]
MEENSRLPTGSKILDGMLNGGYERDVITTLYGPAGSGKTVLCLLCAINVAKDKKVVYVDSEGGFSLERLKQIASHIGHDYKKI